MALVQWPGGACPVCGRAGGCATSLSQPVHIISDATPRSQGGALAIYRDAAGHRFTMTAADAAAAGYTLTT